MGHRRSREGGVLRVLFTRSKFARFDGAIAFAGDLDCERGMPQSIEDGIGDDGVRNHLAPVIKGQL
jgi:hypothetical protein